MKRRLTQLGGMASPALVAACSDIQSAMAPTGPEAARIALLGLILFAGAAVVMLVVLAAAGIALCGPPGARRRIATDRAVLIGGIAFPVVTLTALLAYGVWMMRASIAPADAPAPLRIEVVGEQWWWRVAYLSPQGDRIASANEIRVPVGREVELTLRSADVIHSFWVPNLAGKVDMIPGRTNILRITAAQPGVSRGQCAEYCGGAHALMAIEIVAMPEAEFTAWLVAEAAPAPDPADETTRRGRALFLAAGCGSCHAVRGTPAAGAIGPDLSRVGARRFIAAAALPMTQENLARFIAEGQHVKPGNFMPPFRLFSAAEIHAVSAYLAGLK